MDQVKSYLKKNGLKLLLLAFTLTALGLIGRGFYQQYRQKKTVYVLGETRPDSVFTAPRPSEQSAKARWDSLNQINP
ncbi:hypothetical protein [Spirosoma agri]|uniref:Uncharacterized protein n=1 Tax=Spirosoma agri TaxID=1987381 RepID=A0A6M0ILK7_9BACT|nr:hypothetical protein [Spirosoma agri]NEU68291.1 hypothetical protein [Spirosoma agri]